MPTKDRTEHPSLPLTIAIDGPVGAGKSSIADAVAKHLHILHLDTGAMYRALALGVLRAGILPEDTDAVSAYCSSGLGQVDVRFAGGRQMTLLNQEDVSGLIRSEQVGAAASAVSRLKSVRQYLVSQQRRLAQGQSMLIDGRDIGTVVLPQARVKIFLTASPAQRAQRRLEQLRQAGNSQATFEQVLADLTARDLQDTQRPLDPLRQAADAVLLDTTHLSFDQSVQQVLQIVEHQLEPK